MLLGEVKPRIGEVQPPPLGEAVLVDIGEDEGDDVNEVIAGLLGLTNRICCLMLGVGISSIWKSARLTLMPESESTLPPFWRSLTGRGPFFGFAFLLCLSVSL